MRHKPLTSLRSQPRRAVEAPPAPVRVEIGRLTIEGYTRAQQRLFTKSFHESLHAMATSLDPQQANANRAIRRLDFGSLKAGASAKDSGHELARRICSTIFESRGRKI